jgi:hypothetical protein
MWAAPAAAAARILEPACDLPALATKLMPLRMRVISSTGTLPPVSFTSSAAIAKMNAAHSTQHTPEAQTVLHRGIHQTADL